MKVLRIIQQLDPAGVGARDSAKVFANSNSSKRQKQAFPSFCYSYFRGVI